MPKVYFISMYDPAEPERDQGRIKVGITGGDVGDRVARLQAGNPLQLRCEHVVETPCAREVEQWVHRTRARLTLHGGWLRMETADLPSLVAEAHRQAAAIEDLEREVAALQSRESNGQERLPGREEQRLHDRAVHLKRELVPARLRLETVRHRLRHHAVGAAGVPLVLSVSYIPSGRQFQATVAEERFPELTGRYRYAQLAATFRWREVPSAAAYPVLRDRRDEARAQADAAIKRFLQAGDPPPREERERTPDVENAHDEFLRWTRKIALLEGELQQIRRQLIIAMGPVEALRGVCSHRRVAREKLDSPAFRRNHPREADQCRVEVGPQVRVRIYPSRAY